MKIKTLLPFFSVYNQYIKDFFRIMKISFLLLFACVYHLFAVETEAQNVVIKVKSPTITIGQLITEIENQTDYLVVFRNKEVDTSRQVRMNTNQAEVSSFLNEAFSGTDIDFQFDNNYIILAKKPEEKNTPSTLQQVNRKVIKGTVTDESGEPIIGANVKEKGTTNGVITDMNGAFSFSTSDNAALEISYIGYVGQEIAVKSQNFLQIVLVEDNKNLEEVVIVGYGMQKKVNLTGSVASVNADDIAAIPASNLSAALSGRLAGVRISQSTGRPGASSSLEVRAKGTFKDNNTEPLYVIDGVVRDKFAFDGLDASEVESLSVLKDGASAAIYGARAANGVVLVNTKKGTIGKPVISYTGTIGISDATSTPDVMSAYESAIFSNDYLRVANVPEGDTRYYTPDELEYFKNNRYDWLDEAWKNPIVTRHSVNVSGGNNLVRYFVGGSYFYETGSFDNLSFRKYNFRGNIEANITKDIIASLNLNMDTRKDDKPYWQYDNDSDNMSNLYQGLLTRTLHAPYIDGMPNGTFIKWHPMEVINGSTGYNKKRYNNYEATAALQYNVPFIPGLSLKVQYNKYDKHTFFKQFNRPYPLYVFKTTGQHNHITTNELSEIVVRNDGDNLYEKYNKSDDYQLNAYITYAQKFGKHDVGGLLVYEQSEGFVDWLDGRRNYFISSAIDQLFAGSSDPKNSTLNGSGEETARVSYVGRFNYGYNDKYLVEASFRYDGSVRFAPKNRWGFFPSGSLAWRVSEENFWKNNVKFIDYFKLRGSIGLLGNDYVGGWQWMQRYKLVDGAQFGSLSSGVENEVIPNKDITWEKSLSYNGGFDMALLSNKLTLSFDAFYRHTYDILGDRLASLPTTFGAKMPKENYAVIDSKGFEVEFSYNDKIGSDFQYSIRGNMGYAVNELKEKDEAENLRPYKSEIGHNTTRQMGYIATDVIRTQADLDALPDGYTIMGKKPELGMLNYRDIRGANSDEPDGKIDDNDQEWIIKYTVPPVNYGFSLGAFWKGINVDIFFQGVAGGKTVIDQRSSWPEGMEASHLAFWNDHWTPDNVNAEFPRADNQAAEQVSTFWVRNSSYLRMKNLNISYSLPKSITAKLNVSQLKFFFTGTNLFLLYNGMKYYDPEISGAYSYPTMKSYSFGVNLQF